MGIVQAVFVKRIVPRIGDTRAILIGFCISMASYVAYGLASHGWMIYAIMVPSAFAGIAGPALQSYTTRQLPANEQGSLQGLFMALASLAGIFGPAIGTWSFGWAMAPLHAVHVSRWFGPLEQPLAAALNVVLPHHPGIAFFEGAAVTGFALLLAARSFRTHGAPATPPVVPVG
jgi:DHA1 family tetracycline resistance protein-like MFS transporter